jgi:hypothetical protein
MDWSSKQRDRILGQKDRELDLVERQVLCNEISLQLWTETTKTLAGVLRRLEAVEQKLDVGGSA